MTDPEAMLSEEGLWFKILYEWATYGQLRCRAYTAEGPYAGRCELRKGHDGDHALERGFDIPRWSTRWTS